MVGRDTHGFFRHLLPALAIFIFLVSHDLLSSLSREVYGRALLECLRSIEVSVIYGWQIDQCIEIESVGCMESSEMRRVEVIFAWRTRRGKREDG